MAFTGYTPAPNGGYNFQKDDGSTMLLYGGQADDLARFLDQTRPPDARLAANGPGTFAAPAALRPPDVGYDPANPMAGLPKFEPQPPPAPAADAATQLPPQPAPGDLPVIGGEASGQGQEAGLKDAYRKATIRAVLRGKYHPGTAPVNPGELQATGVPVETQETISGAVPETPQEREDRLERQANTRIDFALAGEEMKANAAERVQLAEEARANALNATIAADQERRDAEKTLQAAKSAADSKWAEIQKENEAVAAQKVDPNRLFHGKNGAAVAIGSALMQGLGAFGSSLARAPNYAHQIINSAIERDIASQADAIQRQGAAARNAVADFARTYGLTLDEAKLAVKSAQLKYAASMAEMNGAKLGTLDAKQKAAALSMDLTKQSEALAMEMRNGYEGRATKHYQIVRPTKGTAGYYDEEPTLEALGKGASTLATTEKAFPGAEKSEGQVVPNLTRAATAVDTGLRALPELEKLSQDAGTFGQGANKLGTKASFGIVAPSELTTAAQHMAYSVASAEVNGMVPDNHRVEELTDLFSASNPTTRKRNIALGADILRKKKQSIESVSSKTAKIGSIAIDQGGGGEQ